MKNLFLTLIFVILSVYLISCAGTIPVPQQSDEGLIQHHFPGKQLSQLIHGRELYVNKCSGCHSLKNPSDYTTAQWNIRIIDMKKEAKLQGDEPDVIISYLLTYAKDSPVITQR